MADKTKKSSSRSSQRVGASDTFLKNIVRKTKLAIWNVEQTDFHPDFVRMYEEAKEFGKTTKMLIDRVKNMVQPNPAWRRDTLPPPDEYTALELFSSCLNETGSSLKAKSLSAAKFYTKEAEAILESGKLYGQFLMAVRSNTLKPMEKYLNDDLEQIRNEYCKLQRYKTMYDDGRNKLKVCAAEKIEKAALDLNDVKAEFEKQANLVTELLLKMPEHKESQRKAFRQLALAQMYYHDKSNELMLKMLQETLDTASTTGSAGGSVLKH